MPEHVDHVTNVARAIQLALAPVFLLTGIAGLLNVMAGRLSRIIDRARRLTESDDVRRMNPESVVRELQGLERRRHLTSVAITACTIAALMLCSVIAALFFEAMFNLPLNWVIGILFTASTLALVVGLAFFLREVHLGTQTRIAIPRSGTGTGNVP